VDYYTDDEKISVGTERQLVELNKMIVTLRTRVAELESELAARDRLPVPKTIIQQIVEMEAIIRKQQADIAYYKKHVNPQIIINKENKEKPTRRGGLPR
jgi:hypothetical protein